MADIDSSTRGTESTILSSSKGSEGDGAGHSRSSSKKSRGKGRKSSKKGDRKSGKSKKEKDGDNKAGEESVDIEDGISEDSEELPKEPRVDAYYVVLAIIVSGIILGMLIYFSIGSIVDPPIKVDLSAFARFYNVSYPEPETEPPAIQVSTVDYNMTESGNMTTPDGTTSAP